MRSRPGLPITSSRKSGWDDLIQMLEASGDAGFVATHAQTPPEGVAGAAAATDIDRAFRAARRWATILTSLSADDSAFARDTLTG